MKFQTLFEIPRLIKKADGKLEGKVVPTGVIPSFMQEIEDNQMNFPRKLFQPLKKISLIVSPRKNSKLPLFNRFAFSFFQFCFVKYSFIFYFLFKVIF